MDDTPPIVTLMDLPVTVHGFVYHDDNLDTFIVLNSRDTHEKRKETYAHEVSHMKKGQMYDPDYREYQD